MRGGTPLTLGALLDAAAERYPEKAAIVFRGARVTYRELLGRVDRFARGLLALGLGPGSTAEAFATAFRSRTASEWEMFAEETDLPLVAVVA